MANPATDGIQYRRGVYDDSYTGTKEALIAAKLAQAEWFDGIGEVFRKNGCRRRHRKFDHEGREVNLRELVDGGYRLSIDVDGAESERRKAEQEAARSAEHVLPSQKPIPKREDLERLHRKAEAAAHGCQLAVDGFARLIAGTSRDVPRCISLIVSNLGHAEYIAAAARKEISPAPS